ncbi:hypothetical protein C8R44DRAFT_745528 [Mycena epipterygia]|nr:hypothetical protein C8R44DRAFT_745528 [Mycena epipterygia]
MNMVGRQAAGTNRQKKFYRHSKATPSSLGRRFASTSSHGVGLHPQGLNVERGFNFLVARQFPSRRMFGGHELNELKVLSKARDPSSLGRHCVPTSSHGVGVYLQARLRGFSATLIHCMQKKKKFFLLVGSEVMRLYNCMDQQKARKPSATGPFLHTSEVDYNKGQGLERGKSELQSFARRRVNWATSEEEPSKNEMQHQRMARARTSDSCIWTGIGQIENRLSAYADLRETGIQIPDDLMISMPRSKFI